jgi:GntR family transcriptional regulator/MocR family aminotransferase
MCLLDPGDAVWVEDPGFPGVENSLAGSGATLFPISVDDEGLNIRAGIAQCDDARLAYVTPSHQYPTGVTMSLARRFELLQWATRRNAWVLEDDFCCEYRYAGHPTPSLQGLDNDGRVIYVGSFGSVLFPAIQLCYLVIPPLLVDPFQRLLRFIGHHTTSVEQAVLADFISEGHFASHLRKMRKLYAARQEILVKSIERCLQPWIEVEPADAGMHVIGWLTRELDDAHVAAVAARYGIQLTPISNYYTHRPDRQGLMFGYTSLTERQIRVGVNRLREALRQGVAEW